MGCRYIYKGIPPFFGYHGNPRLLNPPTLVTNTLGQNQTGVVMLGELNKLLWQDLKCAYIFHTVDGSEIRLTS